MSFVMLLFYGISGADSMQNRWEIVAIISIPSIPAVYIHFLCIKKLFKKKKYLLYAISVIIITILFGRLISIISEDWIYKDDPTTYIAGELTLGTILFFSTGIRYIYESNETRNRLLEIEAKQAKAELESLKSQVNPHFLFNSLNNIYGLLLEGKDMATDSILRLSSLLRYMIYSSEKSLVTVEEEVQFLQDYVAMERLRLGNKCEISLDIQGSFGSISIPPFLLIPFVENAFKHGSFATIEESFIKISISQLENNLTLKVLNSYKGNDSRESGIGVSNVKRRLELLMYDSYSLDIFSHRNEFEVILTLQL
jgi:LytS/YehU family sensor histidine kinase